MSWKSHGLRRDRHGGGRLCRGRQGGGGEGGASADGRGGCRRGGCRRGGCCGHSSSRWASGHWDFAFRKSLVSKMAAENSCIHFPIQVASLGYTGYTALTHPETSHCFYSWWPGKSRSSPSRCHCIPPLLLSKTVCENMADRHERVAYPHFLMPRSLSSHHPPEPHPTKCPFSPLLVRQIQGGFLVLLCPFFLLVKSPHIHIFLILSPSSIAKKVPSILWKFQVPKILMTSQDWLLKPHLG